MALNNIVQSLTSFIQTKLSIPLIPISAIMLICSTIKRPGLSPMLITSRIINRQQDFGAPVGVNIDGSPNMMNELMFVIVDELVNALKGTALVSTSGIETLINNKTSFDENIRITYDETAGTLGAISITTVEEAE